MNKFYRPELAGAYTSLAQQARVLSESWIHENCFCPSCGAKRLSKSKNNQPVSDFACPRCGETFELKSQRGPFRRKVVDGAFGSMMKRLAEANSPSLLLLSYDGSPPDIASLIVVPRQFLVPSLIECRPPLGPGARRAGWVGCNIVLESIPQLGRISMFEAGRLRPKTEVNATWQRTTFMRQETEASWLIHVLKGIEALERDIFSLSEVYELEDRLRRIFPGNRHIRPKIRQQLQRLRDAGIVEFVGRGSYRLVMARAEV